MNPYLQRLRTRYDEIRAAMTEIYKAAAEHREGDKVGRDLTEDELRTVEALSAEAEGLVPQIESLTKIEQRNLQVAQMAAQVAGQAVESAPAPPSSDQTRSAESVGEPRRTSSTTAKDRDPGHYRSLEQGGRHSFFADLYRAQLRGDDDARQRLVEHARALDMVGEGVGTTTPKWLFDRFELVLRQERRLANAVTRLPLGRDPRPMTLPKQTVGTSTVVDEQSAENAAPSYTDQFDTDVETITPVTISGGQEFSRQFLDSATPAIDDLIMRDLVANYDLQIEKRVGAAMVTAAGTAVTTFATEAAFVGTAPAQPAIDAVIDAAIAVQAGRYAPADIIAMGTRRWGAFRKLKDSSGRPLIPNTSHSVQNVWGVGDVQFNGEIEGLGVIVTEGINTGSYPESIVVAKASDTILWEGDLMRFRYEEVAGPHTIRVGIWNYVALSVRRPGVGQKRIVVTAAS